jgi:hypothetical protein
MRKIKLVVAAAAVVAGVLAAPLAAGTAHAASDSPTTYTLTSIGRCAEVEGLHDCFEMKAYQTFNRTQIWINGTVSCSPYSGNVKITWCGVGGGNGTGSLNIGANFDVSGLTGLYLREDIFADFEGCHQYGSNADTNYISNWWDDGNYYPKTTSYRTVCEKVAD